MMKNLKIWSIVIVIKSSKRGDFCLDHFKIHSDFKPTGDQPQAIEKLVQGIEGVSKIVEQKELMYDEVIKVLKQEKKYSVKHCWARLFGHKSQYIREQKAIELAQKLEEQAPKTVPKMRQLPKPTAQN